MAYNNLIPADILLYEAYVEECEANNTEPKKYIEWRDTIKESE
jgi:hypothetical protein